MVAKTYALFAITVWSIAMTGCARCSTAKTGGSGVVSTTGDYQAFVEHLDDIFEDDYDEGDDDDDEDEDDEIDDDGVEIENEEDIYDDDMENEMIEILTAVQWLSATNGGTVEGALPYYEQLYKLQKEVADDFDRNALDFAALYSAWAEFAKAPWDTDQQLQKLAQYQRLFGRYAADRERLRIESDKLRELETALLPSTVYPIADEIPGERMKQAFAMATEQAAADGDGEQSERSLFPDTPADIN